MKTRRTESRKLALRRETLRALDSLTPDQLLQAAGAGGINKSVGNGCASLSGGTKYC